MPADIIIHLVVFLALSSRVFHDQKLVAVVLSIESRSYGVFPRRSGLESCLPNKNRDRKNEEDLHL